MVTQDKISSTLVNIAINCKCRDEIYNTFSDLGRTIDKTEDIGGIAVALDNNGKLVKASAAISLDDKIEIENWARNERSNRLTKNLFKVLLHDHVFIFKKHRSKSNKHCILVGALLEKTDEIRFLTTVLQAKELSNYRVS